MQLCLGYSAPQQPPAWLPGHLLPSMLCSVSVLITVLSTHPLEVHTGAHTCTVALLMMLKLQPEKNLLLAVSLSHTAGCLLLPLSGRI
jgi:hypothetical protein